MTPREILIAARAKIEAPERWTKEAYALDANGDHVACDYEGAVRWCAVGAIGYVGQELIDTAFREFLPEGWILENWNDAPERTHAEVLAAFDRAIELAGDA